MTLAGFRGVADFVAEANSLSFILGVNTSSETAIGLGYRNPRSGRLVLGLVLGSGRSAWSFLAYSQESLFQGWTPIFDVHAITSYNIYLATSYDGAGRLGRD